MCKPMLFAVTIFGCSWHQSNVMCSCSSKKKAGERKQKIYFKRHGMHKKWMTNDFILWLFVEWYTENGTTALSALNRFLSEYSSPHTHTHTHMHARFGFRVCFWPKPFLKYFMPLLENVPPVFSLWFSVFAFFAVALDLEVKENIEWWIRKLYFWLRRRKEQNVHSKRTIRKNRNSSFSFIRDTEKSYAQYRPLLLLIQMYFEFTIYHT